MDQQLADYRNELAERTGLTFPEFHAKALHSAPLLAVLQDPGKSGAVESGVCCCIKNDDPTSKNQREIIFDKVGLQGEQIVCWNFRAA